MKNGGKRTGDLSPPPLAPSSLTSSRAMRALSRLLAARARGRAAENGGATPPRRPRSRASSQKTLLGVLPPGSLVGANAVIAPGVRVGPFCVIGDDAVIGPNCELGAGVHVIGRVTLGADCVVRSRVCSARTPPDRSRSGAAYPDRPCRRRAAVAGREARPGARRLAPPRRRARRHPRARAGAPRLRPGVEDGHRRPRVDHGRRRPWRCRDWRSRRRHARVNRVLLAGHVRVGGNAVVLGAAAVQQARRDRREGLRRRRREGWRRACPRGCAPRATAPSCGRSARSASRGRREPASCARAASSPSCSTGPGPGADPVGPSGSAGGSPARGPRPARRRKGGGRKKKKKFGAGPHGAGRPGRLWTSCPGARQPSRAR